MNRLLIVNRDLGSARRELSVASEHLGHTVYGGDSIDAELRRAIEATIRAVVSVALIVERLAELDWCDGEHAL